MPVGRSSQARASRARSRGAIPASQVGKSQGRGAMSAGERRLVLPSDIPGLELWLAADHLLLRDGDTVQTWFDNGPKKIDFAQASAPARPIYRKNRTDNGMPGVTWQGDGPNQNLVSAASSVVTAPPITTFLVCKHTISNQTDCFWWNGRYHLSNAGVVGEKFAFVTSLVQIYPSPDPEHWRAIGRAEVYAATFEGGASSFKGTLYRADSGIRKIQSHVVTGTQDGNGSLVPMKLGKTDIGGSYFNGDMFELLIYSSLLSPQNIYDQMYSLGSKWGISTG